MGLMRVDRPYYQEGNTVKLSVRFGDFDEDITTYPDEVMLKIYNDSWELEKEYRVENPDSDGFYEQFHSFDEVGTYFYEWFGLFNGMPSLERKKIIIKKV